MSGYKRVSFYELCRLCASNTQKEKTHIFKEEGRKIQLQNKIQFCLALTVNEDDFLPKVVCSKCLRSLETCFVFRQECVRSESMLSTYFKNFRYTDDFKRSGKVYIKDIKPPHVNPTNGEPTKNCKTTETATIHQNIIVNNKNQQNIEQVPFYALQLPTVVSNSSNIIKSQKSSNISKVNPNQYAYNLNLVNGKVNLPNSEILSNVVVNSSGEVINIAHMGDFETVLNQGNCIKTKNKYLKQKELNNDTESVVHIDLTESDNSEYDVESNNAKFDKLPHIKSTQTHTKLAYDKPQTQTVIYPMPEYNQTFNNFNSNVTYAQSNENVMHTNCTNVITNTASTVETSALNVINPNLQEITQPVYTNVIAANNSAKSEISESETVSGSSVVISNNNQQKTHVCEVCQRAFKRREHLYQHVKLHTGFRPYICEHCNKAFMRKEHLLRHSTLHSGQKNFTCTTCEKSFSRNDNLLKHKKTHEKQKRYKCEICHKQFIMKHYYVIHKSTHDKLVWGFLKSTATPT